VRGKRRGPINNIVWEAISKTSFYSSAHNVKEWRSKATSLFKVAHILPPLIDNEWARQPAYKLIEVRNVYLMLVGYSFEGLGKALLIQKQSPIAKNGTFIHISHNLIDIFSKDFYWKDLSNILFGPGGILSQRNIKRYCPENTQ